AQHRRRQREVVGAVSERELEAAAAAEAAHGARPTCEGERLLHAAGAAVAAKDRRVEPVHVHELDGLGIVARRELDLVAARAPASRRRTAPYRAPPCWAPARSTTAATAPTARACGCDASTTR